jgi:hypothetical protein
VLIRCISCTKTLVHEGDDPKRSEYRQPENGVDLIRVWHGADPEIGVIEDPLVHSLQLTHVTPSHRDSLRIIIATCNSRRFVRLARRRYSASRCRSALNHQYATRPVAFQVTQGIAVVERTPGTLHAMWRDLDTAWLDATEGPPIE